jgi:menaquinone-dependent protoporphyrinogen IX oxidase
MNHRLQRVLVLFSTVSGCTASIARRIGSDLIAYGIKPTVMSVEQCPEVSEGEYDSIIIGSGARLGRWHRDVRDWIARNGELLKSVPVRCFTVGLHGIRADGSFDETEAREAMERIMSSSGIPQGTGGVFFPGWKRTEGFSSMERIALRVYPLAEGDYRDWDLVDAWVRGMAPELLRKMEENSRRRGGTCVSTRGGAAGTRTGAGRAGRATGDMPASAVADGGTGKRAGVAAAVASESSIWSECFA